MKLVFGYLPEGTGEQEIRELLHRFATVTKVVFFDNTGIKHSDYECIATLDITDPMVGSIVANRLNHYYWKGRNIKSHMLLYQNN